MEGFKSPLYLLGLGNEPASGSVEGSGASPLPFPIGLVSASGSVEGSGASPLPFPIGLVSTGALQGRGSGPLPFTVGVVAATDIVIPVQPGGGPQGGIYIRSDRRDPPEDLSLYRASKVLDDDDELLEIISMLLRSGVFD